MCEFKKGHKVKRLTSFYPRNGQEPVIAGGVYTVDRQEKGSLYLEGWGDYTFDPSQFILDCNMLEECREKLTPESKVTIEGKRYKLVRDLPEINEVEVGDFIKILTGKEDADYSDNGYSLEAGDIFKVVDIDEGCGSATLTCIKLFGEGSFNSGYIYNRALEDNFEIVEVEVTVKEK